MECNYQKSSKMPVIKSVTSFDTEMHVLNEMMRFIVTMIHDGDSISND